MSPSGTILIGLFLYLRQAEPAVHCDVLQPQLLVLVVQRESARLLCQYQCESTNKSVPLTQPVQLKLLLFRDSESNVLNTGQDTIISKLETVWDLPDRGANDSGMYFCQGTYKSTNFKGPGTLLLVHLGEKPADNTRNVVLLAVCCGLAAYCLCLTTVVCIRKKTCSRCKSSWAKTHSGKTRKPSATEQAQSGTERPGEPAAGAAESENAYMALQGRQESFYHTLHNKERSEAGGTSTKRKKAEQTEVEDAAPECVYETF
ncbi:uncharacterized protein LOC129713755 [Leucoraja erinacea]|uniref:uncharacterized protein LOC129713755 n=1 Tax=Leucoraja erinaceus TaxID=7782 RepID=UPI002454CB89|nr:uncharacterized protein LOC129713755 [Leucoraja erinacea]